MTAPERSRGTRPLPEHPSRVADGPSLAALTAITLMHTVLGCTLVAVTQAWAGETLALVVAAAAFIGWLIHVAIAGGHR